MQIKVVIGDIVKTEADAIIVNLFEGVEHPGGATDAVDKALGGAITQLVSKGEIKGKFKEVNIIHTLGKLPANKVAVAGLGKQAELTLDKIRGISAEVCRALQGLNCKRIATIMHGAGVGGVDPEASAQAIVEGSLLGLYSFRRHITKKSEHENIEEMLIVQRDETRLEAIEKGCHKGKIIAEATNMARNMVNEPANYMTPKDMAETAGKMAKDYGLEVTVLEREDMEKLCMGALLGVAQGSREPPKLVVLSYKGDKSSKSVLGFVGKGITFDSGGISLKSAEGLEEMKGDMAGGATVMTALVAIAQLKPKVNVVAIVPATENLPGGGALKPGDILTAMNGKTIEVVTTDAEGRLILADALCYARKQGLAPLIDLATLTGSCRVALGDICAGVFSNDQQLADKVIKAGSEAGECLWQMPMYEEYKEQNKSEVADIKNSGGRYGGAITAALFLAEFVEDIPWVHVDIAGTSRSEKERTYTIKGATGFGVRTLVNLALALAEEKGG